MHVQWAPSVRCIIREREKSTFSVYVLVHESSFCADTMSLSFGRSSVSVRRCASADQLPSRRREPQDSVGRRMHRARRTHSLLMEPRCELSVHEICEKEIYKYFNCSPFAGHTAIGFRRTARYFRAPFAAQSCASLTCALRNVCVTLRLYICSALGCTQTQRRTPTNGDKFSA